MDYGNSSPDSIVVSYKFKPNDTFFEVKRITGLERNNEWHPLLSREEVNEINEVILSFFHFFSFRLLIFVLCQHWRDDSQDLDDERSGTIRIEISRNVNNGMISCIGGLKVLYPINNCNEVETEEDSEEQRKDAICKSFLLFLFSLIPNKYDLIL